MSHSADKSGGVALLGAWLASAWHRPSDYGEHTLALALAQVTLCLSHALHNPTTSYLLCMTPPGTHSHTDTAYTLHWHWHYPQTVGWTSDKRCHFYVITQRMLNSGARSAQMSRKQECL